MSNPYISGFPFGVGNYPTGASPWSGQTAAQSDGLAFYTPGNTLQAQGLNYRFNQIENAILYVNRFARDDTKYVLADMNTNLVYTGGSGWGAISGTYDSVIADLHVEYQDVIAAVLPNDIVEVTLAQTMKYNGTAGLGVGHVRLEWLETGAGGTSTTKFDTPETDQVFKGTTTVTWVPLTLVGRRIIATAGQFKIALNGHVDNAGSAGDWYTLGGALTWRLWRPT